MIRIAPTSHLDPGECMYVVVEGKEYAVANVEGTYHVLDNACPHQGAPLGDGFLDGCLLTCSLHAWQFDVKTGEMPDNPKLKVKTYPVVVQDGEIFITEEKSEPA